jgi:hypothetical protein
VWLLRDTSVLLKQNVADLDTNVVLGGGDTTRLARRVAVFVPERVCEIT